MIVSVSFKITLDVGSGTTATIGRCLLSHYKASTGVYAVVEGSNCYTYNPNSNGGMCSASGSHILVLSAGDKLRCRAARQTGANLLKTTACNIVIMQI